jgi:predicted transcriptional regulator of viral defense system
MRFEEVFKELTEKKYYVFSCEDLCAFFSFEKKTTIKQYLSRWKKGGLVAALRKNLYELTYPKPYGISDMYLANKIYAPSYVSLETALSHYSLIPEVSMAVTSITAKTTRRFKNNHGLFIYRSVRPQAFRGTTIENHNGFNVLIAEPEKALADFLYFKTLRVKSFDAAALRLDKKRIRNLDRKKMDVYAGTYGISIKGILHDYL